MTLQYLINTYGDRVMKSGPRITERTTAETVIRAWAAHDPLTTETSLGPYSEWLVRTLLKDGDPNDMGAVLQVVSIGLKYHHRYKKHLALRDRNIQNFASFSEFMSVATPLIVRAWTKWLRRRPPQAAAEDTLPLPDIKNGWTVTAALNCRGARKLGRNADWCTAGSGYKDRFRQYSIQNQTVLFVLQNPEGELWQTHLEGEGPRREVYWNHARNDSETDKVIAKCRKASGFSYAMQSAKTKELWEEVLRQHSAGGSTMSYLRKIAELRTVFELMTPVALGEFGRISMASDVRPYHGTDFNQMQTGSPDQSIEERELQIASAFFLETNRANARVSLSVEDLLAHPEFFTRIGQRVERRRPGVTHVAQLFKMLTGTYHPDSVRVNFSLFDKDPKNILKRALELIAPAEPKEEWRVRRPLRFSVVVEMLGLVFRHLPRSCYVVHKLYGEDQERWDWTGAETADSVRRENQECLRAMTANPEYRGLICEGLLREGIDEELYTKANQIEIPGLPLDDLPGLWQAIGRWMQDSFEGLKRRAVRERALDCYRALLNVQSYGSNAEDWNLRFSGRHARKLVQYAKTEVVTAEGLADRIPVNYFARFNLLDNIDDHLSVEQYLFCLPECEDQAAVWKSLYPAVTNILQLDLPMEGLEEWEHEESSAVV